MRRVAYLLGVAALAALAPQAMQAQTIRGVLVINGTTVTVPNARVWLTTGRGHTVDTTRSDANGHFEVKADRPGSYYLNVRRLGYFPEESDDIRLRDGEVRTDTVYLLSPQVLKPVNVVVKQQVDRYFGVNINALSSSNVITPEEIDRVRGAASTLEDVLRWHHPPSLTITRVGGNPCFQIRMRGCAPVFLDGMPIGTDGWFPANEIQSIVVIPGNEAFIRYGSSRGVIAVFTNFSADR